MRSLSSPSGVPFLPALAAGLRERLPEPEALARATILLPTRRSARALRREFTPADRGAGDAALLLPRMRALAGLSTEDADELTLPALLELPPAVAPLRRQGVLASFVQRFPPRGGGVTIEQAWGLAGELASLLDEIALEERDLDLLRRPDELAAAWLARLEGLVEGELARHWQITTIFLRGVVQAWQGWLAENALLDVGVRRVLALVTQAQAWQAAPPAGLVVAAGIGLGGTIPAAAALLQVIAGLPDGHVVLHAEEPATAALEPDALDRAPTHPWFGQRKLLAMMGAGLGPFPAWTATAAPHPRARLLGEALRPADTIPAWQSRRPDAWQPALAGLSAQVAPDAEAEARAIALLLREALETDGAAALVTPDRDLARRTAAALTRHGIEAEDSAGQPLGLTPAGVFLRLVAAMAAEEFAPVATLSLLKHPLCAGGLERGAWLRAARACDLAWRGPRPEPGLEGLRQAISTKALERCLPLLDALEAATGGLTALPRPPAHPPTRTPARPPARPAADLLAALLEAAEALAGSDRLPGGVALYAGEEGEALATHLADMDAAFAELGPISPASFPALFEEALALGVARRPRSHSAHPRVAILGLLEARLLHFDRVVLGGLDEAVWPLATDPGPWMGRLMRAEFGLPAPEERIGRVAADFLLVAASAGEAVLSRAGRRGGAPTVPARWLTRLHTFLRGQRNAAHPEGLALPAGAAVGWAAALDQPAGPLPLPERPRPAPAAHLRPRRISVTEVGTLIADPYAYYARRMLNLQQLEPLEAEIGAREYGNIVHQAMHRFIAGDAVDWDAAAQAALLDAALRPSLDAFWRPRLARIGEWVVKAETEMRAAHPIRRSHTEAKGEANFRGVLLYGRADRIDERRNGDLVVFDYKTGTMPARGDVERGTAPQLPLEGLLLTRDGFAGIKGLAARLAYGRLSGAEPAGETRAFDDAAELVEAAGEGLEWLLHDFLLGDRAFVSRPDPGRENRGRDFDHLARRAEWEAEG